MIIGEDISLLAHDEAGPGTRRRGMLERVRWSSASRCGDRRGPDRRDHGWNRHRLALGLVGAALGQGVSRQQRRDRQTDGCAHRRPGSPADGVSTPHRDHGRSPCRINSCSALPHSLTIEPKSKDTHGSENDTGEGFTLARVSSPEYGWRSYWIAANICLISGVSREMGSWKTCMVSWIFPVGRRSAFPTSSALGSRPNCWTSLRDVRKIRCEASVRWTGILMVLDWSARARVTP